MEQTDDVTAVAAGSWILAFDVLAVVVFVAVGRDTHDEAGTVAGVTETAAPFLLALAVAWGATRAWRRPAATRTGESVAALTVTIGMLLRRLLFDEGTAFAFVVVASVFLGLTFVGWRSLARAASRKLNQPA